MRTQPILLVAFLLFLSSTSSAQQPISIRGIGDVEICLGNTLDTSVFIFNNDNVSHKVRFSSAIRNVVTGIAVWGDSVPQEATIAASSSLRVPIHYVTDPNKLSELGTFRFVTTAVQLDANNAEIPSTRDSVVCRLFGIRRTTNPFRDYSNNFGTTLYGDIPDQTMWTAYGATIVSGAKNTFDPPPPQGYWGVKDSLESPLIKLDRRDEYGRAYSGKISGDTLVSFPINLQGQTSVVISFDFMRGSKRAYPYMWDSDSLHGPESTVLFNGRVARPGDSLILEFKDPSDAQCGSTKWNEILGIDGGRDLTFKRLWLEMVDSTQIVFRMTGDTGLTTIPSMHYLDASFRFRLRLKSNDNGQSGLKPDDDDAWYVDNVTVEVPRHPEFEALWARAVSPYTTLSHDAASAIPVYMKIGNNTTYNSIDLPLSVTIADSLGHIVYSKSISLQTSRPGVDTVVEFPDWDAHDLRAGKYLVTGGLDQSGYQENMVIAQTGSIFYLNVNDSGLQELGYDDGSNDIPTMTQTKGAGIGFANNSGTYAMKIVLRAPDTLYGVRAFFASANAGEDAIRISLFQNDSAHNLPGDTIQGVRSEFVDVRKGGYFNQFWPYYFPKPIPLAAGTYWVGVSQLGLSNMELGGDLSRGGAYVEVGSLQQPVLPAIYSDPYATQSSPTQNNGDIHTTYAIETPAGQGNWMPWMPDSGYWPTNAGNSFNQFWATNPEFNQYSRAGSYLPMIRALMSLEGFPPAGVRAEHSMALTLDAPNPNPIHFGEALTLHYALDKPMHATLAVIDPLGRVVTTLAEGTISSGDHYTHWKPETTGSYFVKLATSDGSSLVRMIVVQ